MSTDTVVSESPFADAAAAAVEEELSEEQKLEQEKDKFFAALKENLGPDAPDEAWLDNVKETAGRVRWFEFSPTEIYFFRPFRNSEYKGWLESLKNLGEADPDAADQRLREQIVSRCVLYPKLDPTEMGALFGGTLDTLYLQIRLASNFIPAEMAVNMVREW